MVTAFEKQIESVWNTVMCRERYINDKVVAADPKSIQLMLL